MSDVTDTRLTEAAVTRITEEGFFRALEDYGAVPGVVYSDDFNRANGDPGADWTAVTNMAIASNKLTVTSSGASATYATALGDDQWSEAVTDVAIEGSIAAGVMTRKSAGGYYYVWRDVSGGNSRVSIWVHVAPSTYTQVGAYVNVAAGPLLIRLESEGTTHRAYVDDVEVTSGTDSAHASGAVGVLGHYGGGTIPTIDDWRGGELPYPTVPTVPGAPTGTGVNAGDGQVTLTWTAPSSGGSAITDYVVQYRTTAGPGTWTTFSDGVSTATTATVTGLTNGTSYDFHVAAVNAIGQGAYSATATAVPAVPGTTATLIQYARNGGDIASANQIAFTSPLTAGSTLVIVSTTRRTGTLPTISDNLDHDWALQEVAGPLSGGFADAYCQVWTAPNTATGSCTVTIGFTGSSGNFWQNIAFETDGVYVSSTAPVLATGGPVTLTSAAAAADGSLVLWTLFNLGFGDAPPFAGLTPTALFNAINQFVGGVGTSLGSAAGATAADATDTVTASSSSGPWWAGVTVEVAPPPPAAAVLQHIGDAGWFDGSLDRITFPDPLTADSTIVALVWIQNVIPAPAITSTVGHTFTPIDSQSGNNGSHTYLYTAPNTSTASGVIIDLNAGSEPPRWGLFAWEVANGTLVDTLSTNVGGSTPSLGPSSTLPDGGVALALITSDGGDEVHVTNPTEYLDWPSAHPRTPMSSGYGDVAPGDDITMTATVVSTGWSSTLWLVTFASPSP